MLRALPQFDLAIVGGGPAGSSAAITAARLGASVVLFEARNFPRHKVCGEFVSAEALDVLASLLQNLPTAGVLLDAAPAIHRTRLWLGTRMIAARVSPAALSITRYDLDAQLWSAAQAAGVETRTNCEVAAVDGSGPFRLTTPCGNCSAKALLIAAGRWSQFTPDRSIPTGPRWIGVKAHFREPNPSLSTDLYFFEHGYCGVQPVAKDVINACAMVRSDRATSLQEVFRLHPKLAERAAGWSPVSQSVSTAPLIYRSPKPVRGNVMFAGDAAAFIDPFVGDGISIALRSGRLAAQCVCMFLSGEIELYESVALYRDGYARQFSPLLSAASRVRSLLSLPVVVRTAVFELLRLPGVMPLVIRKTRRAKETALGI
ncbi:MAG: NAD(P)/FAD-dependent oxidoreductase [Candidatus Korobacteraceae bacterium]|jgi:flavin-dependent dehydrogenase